MYSEAEDNKRKTVVIMTLFVGVIVGLAWVYAQVSGGSVPFITIGALIGTIIYTVISYFASAKLALAVNGAREIEQKDNPRLWRIVENLSITNGMPMPKVYIMDEPAPNAFATGRDPKHAAVCATTGLLEIMDNSELEGVMAHELGHVKNYDIRVSMIAFGLTAAIGLLADILLRMTWFGRSNREGGGQIGIILAVAAAILAPLTASLIQAAVSRQREYLADATGAMTTRYPEGLARALEKIGHYGSTLQTRQNASTAHLFFANPLSGNSLATLFSTHPPIEARVKRLHKMGRKA